MFADQPKCRSSSGSRRLERRRFRSWKLSASTPWWTLRLKRKTYLVITKTFQCRDYYCCIFLSRQDMEMLKRYDPWGKPGAGAPIVSEWRNTWRWNFHGVTIMRIFSAFHAGRQQQKTEIHWSRCWKIKTEWPNEERCSYALHCIKNMSILVIILYFPEIYTL